jgi:transposase-like protein
LLYISLYFAIYKKYAKKKCLKCWSNRTKKNGKRAWKQRFLCKSCWYVSELWNWKNSKKPKNDVLLHEYVRDEVKFRQMSQLYSVTKRTIQNRMNDIEFTKNYCDEIEPGEIILLMDTTYFWKEYGYMIFRAWFPKTQTWKNLLWYKVNYETNQKYKEWYEFLKNKWRKIIAIVCDWRQWLLWWFWNIPTQLCIHHMKQIVTRLLTKKPKLNQTKSLKLIADWIWEYPEEDVRLALDIWFQENKQRLDEKNFNDWYIHERARKAYKSVRSKLVWCYTYIQHSYIWIPRTNNSLESINSHLKSKATIHRWMKLQNKDRFTNYYLYIS